jgi:hypothetical protein
MKTITAMKLVAITLVLIFIVVPTTASTGFDAGKSALISGYETSSGYSTANYNTDTAIAGFRTVSIYDLKPDLNIFKNPTITWDPVFMHQTKESLSPSSGWDWDIFTPPASGCGCGG